MGYGRLGFGSSMDVAIAPGLWLWLKTGMDIDIISLADIDDIWPMNSIEEKN